MQKAYERLSKARAREDAQTVAEALAEITQARANGVKNKTIPEQRLQGCYALGISPSLYSSIAQQTLDS